MVIQTVSNIWASVSRRLEGSVVNVGTASKLRGRDKFLTAQIKASSNSAISIMGVYHHKINHLGRTLILNNPKNDG